MRQRHRVYSTLEVERRAPPSNDSAKGTLRRSGKWQLDFSAPSGRRPGSGNAALYLPVEFRRRVNLFNTWVSDCFCRNLVRVAAVPNGPAGLPLADWNGAATQLYNEHRPLVQFEAAGLGDFIIAEMANRKGIASNGLSSLSSAISLHARFSW